MRITLDSGKQAGQEIAPRVGITVRHTGNPQVSALDVAISEYEPLEAFELLVDDDLDLAITYDYNLAPASPDPVLETLPLWSTPWGLGVRTGSTTNGIADLGEFAVAAMSTTTGRRPWPGPGRASAPDTTATTRTRPARPAPAGPPVFPCAPP